MSRLTSLFSIGLFLLILTLPALAQEPETQSETGSSQLLSPQSLDALTAGIALYPDQTVQEALSASTNPQAIESAAALSPEQFQAQSSQFSSGIQYLQANAPELLQQLNQHLSLTTSLGIAAQTQLNDVWASVDRVRAQYQQSTSQSQNNTGDSASSDSATGDSASSDSATGNEASEEGAPTYNTYNDNSTTTTGYGTTGYGGAGAFAAGLVAGNAWQDLYRGRPYYPAYNRYPGNNNLYHNGNNVIGNNVIDDRHPAANGAGGIGGVTGVNGIGGVGGAGGVNGIGGVGGAGGVNGAGGFGRPGGVNGAGGIGGAGGVNGIGGVGGAGGVNGVGGFGRPDGVKGGNSDWVNGIGAGERQNLATNTWGHMDNQAHQSFTGRNGSPANFNNGPNTGRPGADNGIGGANGFGRPGGAGANGGNLNHSQFGGANPSQGRMSPGNGNHNASPSRSFGGAGGGNRGGAGGRAGGGRR